MPRGRSTAIAGALLALLAIVGCGLGPGASIEPVELTVTRDYGSVELARDSAEDVTESDTVMRVLERGTEITTRYGGGFVQSIDGLRATNRGGEPLDWFFYVDGIESPIGAADFSLRGGERVWWDYRAWMAASRVPAVVGSYPAPFAHGYEGKERPVALECEAAATVCERVREALSSTGAELSDRPSGGAIRVLVGPWSRLRDDATAVAIEAGPRQSGVFAELGRGGAGLVGLDQRGRPRRRFGAAAGLVAALRRYDEPPVWVVTGTTTAGVAAAAGLLDEEHLRGRYAVATEGGATVPLPLR